ncbi:MAG: hypothetical protein ACK4PI_10695 [Tepidisphaerales bacterium]
MSGWMAAITYGHGSALAFAAAAGGYTRPFVQPLPVWDHWWALLLPLLVAICIVYKACKVTRLSELPRAAAGMLFWVLAALLAISAGLAVWVRLMQ